MFFVFVRALLIFFCFPLCLWSPDALPGWKSRRHPHLLSLSTGHGLQIFEIELGECGYQSPSFVGFEIILIYYRSKQTSKYKEAFSPPGNLNPHPHLHFTTAQWTTFYKAVMYSGRRFWYLRWKACSHTSRPRMGNIGSYLGRSFFGGVRIPFFIFPGFCLRVCTSEFFFNLRNVLFYTDISITTVLYLCFVRSSFFLQNLLLLVV